MKQDPEDDGYGVTVPRTDVKDLEELAAGYGIKPTTVQKEKRPFFWLFVIGMGTIGIIGIVVVSTFLLSKTDTPNVQGSPFPALSDYKFPRYRITPADILFINQDYKAGDTIYVYCSHYLGQDIWITEGQHKVIAIKQYPPRSDYDFSPHSVEAVITITNQQSISCDHD